MTDDVEERQREYVRQIRSAADEDEALSLLREYGVKAYFQGREHMADRIKKCADDWKYATT